MSSKPSARHTAPGEGMAWGSGVPSTTQSASKDGAGNTVASSNEPFGLS